MWVHTYVVNNCLIYCPGCILQNHLRSSAAWADRFYGPNEVRVLFGSSAIPWNTFFPRELWSSFICCSEIFLLMEMPLLRIVNRGECSSLSPLQHAPAEHLPPGPTWQPQRCLLLLLHTPSLVLFQTLLFPSSMSFSLICRRQQLAWSHGRNS